jgi:hypothetical protein
MPCKRVVAITAALVATALCVPSADARARKKNQYRVDAPANQLVAPSLDGRITGRARTCWHETFVYDARGGPGRPVLPLSPIPGDKAAPTSGTWAAGVADKVPACCLPAGVQPG